MGRGGLFGIEETIVNIFCSPEGEGVVEDEEVDATAGWESVTATLHLFVAAHPPEGEKRVGRS